MIYLLPNIISKEECEFLTTQFDIEKEITKSADDEFTTHSYGFGPSDVFNIYMDKLKPKILETLVDVVNLNNVNTYVRQYTNNSVLKKHIDRTDISITISICLESTTNKEWPLWANIDGKDLNLNANVGDGILLTDADKTTHWRNELVCNNNERVVQFFLHWIPVNYTTKQTKTFL